MADDGPEPNLVSTDRAARYFDVTIGTLQRWAKDGAITPAVRLPGGEYRWDLADLRHQLRPDRPLPTPRGKQKTNTGGHVPDRPEHPPVVAAIVTSHLGVLVGKRNDGKPPWTFIAGKINPGESPADAGVREVKEETGLQVQAGVEIGRRVHPATGVTMIYMAATPSHSTDAFVGDEDELAEVRWVSLTEADTLLPNMYEPVHEYLTQTLE